VRKIFIFTLIVLFMSSFVLAADIEYKGDFAAYYEHDDKTDETGNYTSSSTSEPTYQSTAPNKNGNYGDYATSDFIDTNIVYNDDITLCTWAYKSSWAVGAHEAIIGNWNSGATALNIYIQLSSSTNKPRVFIQNGNCAGNTYIDTTSSISDWTHICVRENNTKADLWIDGVRQGETTKVTSGFCSNLGSYNLGKNGDYGTQFFNGRLDETFFYFGYLSDANITNFFTNSLYYNDIADLPGGVVTNYFELNAKSNRTEQTFQNFTAVLYSDNYTQEYSTTNGTIFFNIPQNTYSLNVSSGGYATFVKDLGTINNSDEYTAYLYENNSIWLNIYDGKVFTLLNQSITIAITGLNTSYFLQIETENGTYYLNNLDADEYEFNFFNNNYPEQKYYVTLQDNEHQQLNAYIINNTFVSSVTPKVIDPYGENVQNALITMQELISGSYQTIGQKYTDATGQSLFYLKIGTTYRAVIDKTGYTTQTAAITPVTNPYAVTLKLSPIKEYNYSVPLNCVSIYQSSPNSGEIGQELTNFSLYVSSPGGLLNWFSVYYNSTSYINITGSPSGGTANLQLNLNETQGKINLLYVFYCDGYPIITQNKTFYVSYINETNTSLYYTATQLQTINIMQRLALILVSIIVMLLIAFELGIPTKGYPFIVILVLIVYTLPIFNFIPVVLTIVLSLLLGISTLVNWGEGGYYG
jgi:hypothetical protein